MSSWRTILSWEELSDEFIEEGQGFFGEEKDEQGNIYRYNRKGEYHNTRGPAVIWADGTVSYFVNGKRHRIGGPAIIRSNGTLVFYQNDKRHRTDGPAIERANGMVEYWVNDKQLSEEEFNEKYGRNRQASLQVKAEDPIWMTFRDFSKLVKSGQVWELEKGSRFAGSEFNYMYVAVVTRNMQGKLVSIEAEFDSQPVGDPAVFRDRRLLGMPSRFLFENRFMFVAENVE